MKTACHAVVLEELPSAVYRVRLEDRREVMAHSVGSVQRNFVRLLPGDLVEVAISPYDGTRGRILRKSSGPQPEKQQRMI
jgi:translation initiation factor IF-1